MGGNEELQKTKNAQDTVQIETRTQETTTLESTVVPVVNAELERLRVSASQENQSLLAKEDRTLAQVMGDSILEYEKRLKADQKDKQFDYVKLDRIENLTMTEIIEFMEQDTHTKHKEFKEMEGAFKALVNYSKNLENAKRTGATPLDYNDAFRLAETTAKYYQTTHKKALHATTYGKERYKVSCRILDIMQGLKTFTAKTAERFKEIDDKADAARIEDIISERKLTEKEKGELIGEWLKNGSEYKKVLEKILNEERLLDKDKQTLTRIVADKNMRLVANKVTLSMVCDENPDVTLGLSALKDKLKKYVTDKIEADEESKKIVFEEVGTFRDYIKKLLTDYKTENKVLIERTQQRKSRFADALAIDVNDRSFWTKSDINELLVDSDDSVFDIKLDIYKTQCEDNRELISQMIDELGYSSLTSDLIKQKVQRELGATYITGGEVAVYEKVKAAIREMKFLAAEEFEAESRISHLMDVCQIPKTDRDVFAKFISKDGTVNGILSQKTSALRDRADQFVENLKGLKAAESLCRNKKLMLKEETWAKIEELKNNMGALDKKKFRSELTKILKSNGGKIDLTKPNMSFETFNKGRSKERVRKDIGFSARILGDLFLESEDIKAVLNKDEIQYFKENIIGNISSGSKNIGDLEYLPTGSIKAVATMLKKNLLANADFIRKLRKEEKDNPAVINEVLMKMSMSTENLSLSDLNDIVIRVKEQHEYDNRISEEKDKMMEAMKAGSSNDSSLSKERYFNFIKQFDYLKTCNKGRYALIAQHLISENDIYSVMMNGTRKELDKYLESTVEKKIGTAIDAIFASPIQKAFKQIYVDKKFKDIYSGKLSGDIALIKNDMKAEQRRYFDASKFDEKKIDKNIEESANEVVMKVVDGKKENAGKTNTVYACAEAVVSSCYEDKEKLRILSSKTSLSDEIKKAYDRYDENREMVENAIKDLATKSDSVFYGYGLRKDKVGVDSCINAATFMSNLSRKMMLTEKQDLFTELPALIENFEKTYKKEKEETAKVAVTKEEIEKGKEIIEKKASAEKVRKDRDKFLGLSKVQKELENVYKNKALVTMGTGKVTSLSHDNWQKARDYVNKKLSPVYSLDKFLVDLLVEKNVNALFNDEIDVHAKWLYNVSDILSKEDEKEEKISADEHKLLVVNAYRNIGNFENKDEKGTYSSDRSKIKGEWYKTFRDNYKDLKKLEELKLGFASLEQERIGLSRNLRAILATGIDISDQNKTQKESFTNRANNAVKYLTYINDFMKCANEVLLTNENYKRENEVIRTEHLLSLRQYYHERIFGELADEKKSKFDEKAWKDDFAHISGNNAMLRFICSDAINESVNSKEFNQKNRNFSEFIGRDGIEKLIKEKGSHGCLKKYNKLSESEKELFALGLMIMEKGAIGFDAGSVSVLANSELREKEVAPRLKELAKYMAGKDYDFKVDYTQAYYKLTNTGEGAFGKEKTAFSKSAFEKALEFAKAITGKMKNKDEKVTKEDKARMGDGVSSIYEASFLGKKKQIDEVDQLRKTRHTPESVKDKLLEYARLDQEKLKNYEKFIKVADTTVKVGTVYVGKKLSKFYLKENREEIELRNKVVKKLEKLEAVDMHRLLAILQNRSVLDDSTEGGGKHIDEEKREELKLLFSEDNQDKAFEQFVKPGACMQALISALSFGMKDKRSLAGTKLTKSDFESKSFGRKSLIDWRLLDKAFSFMEELEKDRITRFAMRSAPNYIEASGNKKAIEAYKENVKGKDETSIKRDDLEGFLKKEAEKDRLSKDNTQAKIALAGYARLTEPQKKLFVKVLARRDFLDISKKNLYKNIFSASKERNFANETGRFRLIDEYIDQSMRGNQGVVLSETAYADAFKSLLSTQVDDTADFASAKHIGDILSKEKYYVMQRDTAVDWKLFIRALQFVNRASYELDMREGNDELYRSAGDISRYGHLSMDYSILRKNIHNTGNQFFRAGVQTGKNLLTEEALGDLKIGGSVNIFAIKNGIKTAAGIIAPSLAAKMDEMDDLLKVEDKKEKRISDLPEWMTKDPKTYDFKQMAIDKGKEMLVGKVYTAEDSLTNQINDLVLDAFSNGVNVDKIGAFIKEKINEKPAPGKEKRLDEIIGDYKVEYQFGDIRDEINTITDKYNDAMKLKDDAYKKFHGDTVKQVLNMKIASSVKTMLENQYTEAIARVLSKIDYEKGEIAGEIEENSFTKEVKGIIEEAMKQHDNAQEFLEELKKKPQELVDKVQDKVKELTGTIVEGAIGKEGMDFIKDKTELLGGIADSMLGKLSWVVDKINKYRVYIDGFRDIALSIKNKNLLSKADEKAGSEETKKKDEETLRKADEFVDERQKKVRDNAVAEHKDMQKLSKQTADTIQNLAIADDVIKMSMALGEEIFGKLDAGVATKLVTAAVNAGIDFAFYCIRCVKDWKMMRTYYQETERGQQVVSAIKGGYEQIAGSKEVMEDELKGKDTLDLVCLGNGYENRDELIRDTGMKMASSIAFCASNFNPVKETRVMATTVMIVLGLKEKIGKTDIGTITGIFDKMKAA